VTLLTGIVASSLSFQFYQIPPMTSTIFGENKAVCMSFLDGLGFFLSASIWAVTGKTVLRMVRDLDHAVFYGAGAALMLKMLPTILDEEKNAVHYM
jgi:hypothetical protein